MQIGDKVRFLNTTGGGIVKDFKGKDIVLIEDSDGFDIPVLIRECVVIEPANEAQVRQTSKPIPSPTTTQPQKVSEKRIVEETKEGEALNVLLAYLPNDIKNLSTTDFECYLINDSNYFLAFTYLSRNENGWTTRKSDTVEPNTKLFIEKFDRLDLNDMEHCCLQFIAYKEDKPFALKNPYSVEMKIDTVKFYKLHSFRENDYFDEQALLFPAVKNDLAQRELTISTEELERALLEKQAPRPRMQAIVKKEKEQILEIDLHIDELLDNTNGLSSGDMLEYQIKKFNEIMSENKNKKGQKIVFIHGKGDGILKNTILKELKIKYPKAYSQDASFQEYGYGATMVTIK